MEFHKVAVDTAEGVNEAVDYILNLNISPDEKRKRIAKTVHLIGDYCYDKVFKASSLALDSTAIKKTKNLKAGEQEVNLAKKIVRNHSLGREHKSLVGGYYDSVAGKSQKEAFENANALDKHPTLTRKVVGETCAYCDKREGTHIDPDDDMFIRHRRCDCLFIVSGYNTRNGMVSNYNKVHIRELEKAERRENELEKYGRELSSSERGLITRFDNLANKGVKQLTPFEKYLVKTRLINQDLPVAESIRRLI